jgi:2-keto-4-pentenoate hydratase/2-oxohepta-3-ene-1,7-dioic acid hydratase in catechol pathway
MKFCRFNNDQIGVVQGGLVYDVTDLVQTAREADRSRPVDTLVSSLNTLLTMPDRLIKRCSSLATESVRLLAPVGRPGKIIGAPVNYHAHIREMAVSNPSPGYDLPDIGTAGLFLKASSSLVGASHGIRLRFPHRRTDHEIELVAIIGTIASDVSESRALDHVAAYCLGLDVTLRGPEDRSFRKSIDSYSVIGPWITTADEIPNPQNMRLTLRNNGEVRQDASTADMIYGVAKLISFASSFYTLYPGDIVFTGTPQGVAPIRAGDELSAECAELGSMRVAVRECNRGGVGVR